MGVIGWTILGLSVLSSVWVMCACKAGSDEDDRVEEWMKDR